MFQAVTTDIGLGLDYRWNNWSDHKLMNNLELTILEDFLHSFAGLNSRSASFPSLPKEMLIF